MPKGVRLTQKDIEERNQRIINLFKKGYSRSDVANAMPFLRAEQIKRIADDMGIPVWGKVRDKRQRISEQEKEFKSRLHKHICKNIESMTHEELDELEKKVKAERIAHGL